MYELAGEFKKVKDEYLEHNLAATLASVGSQTVDEQTQFCADILKRCG